MKLLSVVVPCFNSAQYMSRAIETLLSGGDKMEIIIVNDGSSDDTLNIANRYKEMYPDIIKVVDQENKGHGGAVNSGLEIATGLYFRVVDSDDWVREESLLLLIRSIELMYKKDDLADVIITNFVYEKAGRTNKKVMKYNNVFESFKMHSWNEAKKFRQGQYILMHSTTYNTELLKNINLKLPEHTFYVDNLFVFIPLAQVEKIYYIDTNLYRYYIGRDDQSVNEEVMCKRIDQQIKVNKLMIEALDISKIQSKEQRRYLILYLATIQVVTSVLLNKIGTDDAIKKKKDLWEYLFAKQPTVYKFMSTNLLGRIAKSNTKIGIKLSEVGYKITQKIYGFN